MLKWCAVILDEVLRVKILLKIRPFEEGKDEEAYIKLYNAGFSDYEDVRAVTLQEVRTIEKAPIQNLNGLLIAEWNGRLAGMVQAYVDKLREEKKGFIQSLAVFPEFRRKGIAKQLVSAAIASFKERGMTKADAWAQTDRKACMQIYESFGFKPIRTMCMMKTDLDQIPSDAEGNMDVALREMTITDEKEIALINWLDNEAFKEHFNYRPVTVEETKYLLLGMPWYQHKIAWLASLKNEPAGYVIAGVDVGLNREKHFEYGWVLDIGVLKPYRRKRIGWTLFVRAMRYLKSLDMSDALLYVDEMNPTGAIRLYEKVGFRTLHKSVVFQLPLA
jgi:mycothiol synthase